MTVDILFFIAVALAIAGQGLDVITTNAGLSRGAVETNGIVAKVIKKIGFPAVAFIKVAGFGIGLSVVPYQFGHPLIGALTAAIVAIGGFAAGIINYIRLKKAKQSPL